MHKRSDYSTNITAYKAAIEALQPYKDAISILKKNHFTEAISTSLIDRLGLIDIALKEGLFDPELASSVSEVLSSYPSFTNIQTTIIALGDSISNLIRPEIYDSIQALASSISVYYADVSGISAALKPIIQASSFVDTSWMRSDNYWFVEKNLIASIDLSPISGISGPFADLCRLEQKTSRIAEIPETMVSATSQIASIYEAIKPSLPLQNIISSRRLLEDYCALATRQHELIQKTQDYIEINWRLGVIEAASKYVERQTTWALVIADQMGKQIIEKDSGNVEEPESEESALHLIPTHIGYTRKKNIRKTPVEGLEESSLVTITEKGKKIAEGILRINQIQLDRGKDRVFVLSETVAMSLLHFSNIICTGVDQFGKIIDSLYFVFYENLEHIKLLIGDGDKGKGDIMVRNEVAFQGIFDVKTIRGDLRHDLDHGHANEIKKKMMNVGDCYKKYCGSRPLRERDFKKLQDKLYDEMLRLEDTLISCQLAKN